VHWLTGSSQPSFIWAFVVWRSDVRHFIALFNIIALVAIAGFLVWSVFSRRRATDKTPANQTPFLSDDDLEGRRLERVLGWSLMFVTIFAVSMLVYLVHEPTRQEHSERYFKNGSVSRGATLFANPAGEAYNPVLSLQCANCHGSDGGGGSTTQVIDPDGPNGPQPPESFTWKVPALNTELLRFTTDEVEQIITYGRPGTPMQPFGVAGGGAKNEQTIADLVAYIQSIQKTPKEAKAEAEQTLKDAQGQAQKGVDDAQTALTTANQTLDSARTALITAFGDPTTTTDAQLTQQCDALEKQAEAEGQVDKSVADQGKACRTFLDAADGVVNAQANLDWAVKWQASREDVTDGQLLFESFCARCHTQGWSIFDPTVPNGTRVLGLVGGGGGQGGGIGFNLRDGATERRFGPGTEPGTLGFDAQSDFVHTGSEANKQYGNGGIGSGRMPGFGNMLTDDMITQIVSFERNDLDSTTYLQPSTTTTVPGPTTSTTTKKSGG
jgi:mono/diheme cytochrome c family protein